MTTKKTMILILDGINFLNNDTTTLATDKTKRTEKDITTAGFSWTVIANAEQIPKTCTVIGLLSSRGSVINFLFFFENKASFFDSFNLVC